MGGHSGGLQVKKTKKFLPSSRKNMCGNQNHTHCHCTSRGRNGGICSSEPPPACYWHRPSLQLTNFPWLHQDKAMLSNLDCITKGSWAQLSLWGDGTHQAAVPKRPMGCACSPCYPALLQRGQECPVCGVAPRLPAALHLENFQSLHFNGCPLYFYFVKQWC